MLWPLTNLSLAGSSAACSGLQHPGSAGQRPSLLNACQANFHSLVRCAVASTLGSELLTLAKLQRRRLDSGPLLPRALCSEDRSLIRRSRSGETRHLCRSLIRHTMLAQAVHPAPSLLWYRQHRVLKVSTRRSLEAQLPQPATSALCAAVSPASDKLVAAINERPQILLLSFQKPHWPGYLVIVKSSIAGRSSSSTANAAGIAAI
jgi:hypothetical protein